MFFSENRYPLFRIMLEFSVLRSTTIKQALQPQALGLSRAFRAIRSTHRPPACASGTIGRHKNGRRVASMIPAMNSKCPDAQIEAVEPAYLQ
jgi:hypothetical protein